METHPPTLCHCRKCGKELISDEVAITKKLINRSASVYYCTGCLARAFEVTEQDIENKIRYYKEIGCTLFSQEIAGEDVTAERRTPNH